VKIAVIGGAGFIGSHLCERLHGEGHYVTCVDDLSTGSLGNLAALTRSPRFRLQQHDVTEPLSLIGAERIYNLACPASPVQYQREPIRTLKTSVIGALNLAALARGTGARLLQASTSEVYGDPLQHPQSESYFGNVNPNGPRACYDEGKRAAETVLCDYERCYGLDLRIARIFNTYGPRMAPDDGRVVSQFVCQALAGEDIVIFGDGYQTRSFCYVDDMVSGLIALMEAEVRGPVNLGNPVETAVIDLAAIIRDMTGSASRIVHAQPVADDPARRRPDISRALGGLGWAPSTPLRVGLSRVIGWFRARRGAGGMAARDRA